MQMQPVSAPLIAEDALSRWHPAKRTAFRFVFAYFVIYIIPFPIEYLPFTSSLIQQYVNFWQAVVPWVGKHVLRLSYDITVFQNGSGDTTYNYVLVLCLLALAAAATAIWSVLDRRRAGYDRLYQWLRVYVRFWLASAMKERRQRGCFHSAEFPFNR